MQQIKVDVQVFFPSGAVVQLTEEQVTKVKNYITEVLFGSIIEKPKTRKYNKYSRWTKEETQELLRIYSLPKSEYKKARRQFSSRYGKTGTQISSKLWDFKKKIKQTNFDYLAPRSLRVTQG